MEQALAIVMAAGKGTRMKSKKSKLVHKIYGKEIIRRAVENVKRAGIEEVITVVGYQKEQIEEVLKDTVKYAVQDEQLGTGHAVIQAAKLLEGRKGKVLVFSISSYNSFKILSSISFLLFIFSYIFLFIFL